MIHGRSISNLSRCLQTVFGTSRSLSFAPNDDRSRKRNGMTLTEAKRRAGYLAVDECVTPDVRTVGIGSGSTVVYVVERLLQRGHDALGSMAFVPTGLQSRQLLVDAGLRCADVDEFPELDVAIDGADEIDPALNCIKGGGGCHLREKVVAEAARRFVLVCDHTKSSSVLGERWTKGVPVEVIPYAARRVCDALRDLGCERPTVRLAGSAKSGPVVTDNGNLIIDAHFGRLERPGEYLQKIKLLTGVVEVGLFVGMANVAYIGNEDGTVAVKK